MNKDSPTRSVARQARLGAIFSVSEVAELAGLSVSGIHKAVDAGRLHGIRIGKYRGPGRGGRERIFSALEVRRWMAARRAKRRASGAQSGGKSER